MSDTESNEDICVVMTYGQVYRIDGNGRVYIGSTKKRVLQMRLDMHLRDWRSFVAETDPARQHYMSSYQCFGGPEAATITKLEEIWFADLVELRMREQHHIDATPGCVNIQRAYSSPENQIRLRREHDKRRYHRRSEEQKAAQAARQASYLKTQTTCECSKTYTRSGAYDHRLTKHHIEYVREHGSQSNQPNKLTLDQLLDINEKKRDLIVCECSTVVAQHGMWQHRQSKKHKDYLLGFVPPPAVVDEKAFRTCECGTVCKRNSLYLHRKSNKHLAFVAGREAATP